MRTVDFKQIQALNVAARRERSHHVYCLLVRAKRWLASLWPHATPDRGPCCAPI